MLPLERTLSASMFFTVPVLSGKMERVNRYPMELTHRIRHLAQIYSPINEVLRGAEFLKFLKGRGTFIPKLVSCTMQIERALSLT